MIAIRSNASGYPLCGGSMGRTIGRRLDSHLSKKPHDMRHDGVTCICCGDKNWIEQAGMPGQSWQPVTEYMHFAR